PDETDPIRVIVLLLSYRSSWWSTTLHDTREIKREKRRGFILDKKPKKKISPRFHGDISPEPPHGYILRTGHVRRQPSQPPKPATKETARERKKPRITDSSLPQRPKPPTAEPPPPPAFLFLASFDDERSRFIGGGHQHRLPLPRRLLLWRWDCREHLRSCALHLPAADVQEDRPERIDGAVLRDAVHLLAAQLPHLSLVRPPLRLLRRRPRRHRQLHRRPLPARLHRHLHRIRRRQEQGNLTYLTFPATFIRFPAYALLTIDFFFFSLTIILSVFTGSVKKRALRI
uniref:Uncharacterized protein n=1 Tax=Oryza barthii TaxID=65489 RepID=A0A0D3EPW4_9ORYZ